MIIGAFDIETIPSQCIPQDAVPVFDPADVKIGNLKDPAKIAAKIQDARAEFLQGIDKTMSTDLCLCQICTFVGIAYDTQTDEVVFETNAHWPLGDTTEEYDVVHGGIEFINKCLATKIPLVSFNGVGFDLPIVWFSALRNDVPFPWHRFEKITKKWGTPAHYDLLLCLINYNYTKMAGKKLDFFLRMFGLGSKMEGIDGSKVYENWKAGNHETILEYCRQDVLQTARLFQRVEPWVSLQ